DEPVHLAQVDPALGPVVVEQAQLDPLRYLGEQSEVGPGPVIGGPERIAVAWPYGSRRQKFPIPRAEQAFRSSHTSHPHGDNTERVLLRRLRRRKRSLGRADVTLCDGQL